MGVDLTVYFAQIVLGNEFIGTSVINFDRDYSLFQALGLDGEGFVGLHEFPPGSKLSLHADEGRLTTDEDAYGSKLTYFYPPDLSAEVKQRVDHPSWNKPVLDFIHGIPEHIPIILYWH